MFRCDRDSSGLGTHGESQPGVRLRVSACGVAGGDGKVRRSPQSRARERDGSGLFTSGIGEHTPLSGSSEGDVVRVAGFSSSWEVLLPSGASVERRRVNGNHRCSPTSDGPPEESSCKAMSERRASD
jgi:hypothetical protein